MRRILSVGFVLLVAAVAATNAHASNMGFKKSFVYPFDAGGGGNFHWISVPLFYTPAGAPPLTAQTVCGEFPSQVVVIRHYVDSTLAYDDYTCGSGSGNFTIAKGESIAINNDFFADINGAVVGSHDNSFRYQYAFDAGGGGNFHWISIPYHRMFTDAAPPGFDSEDLCTMIGPSIVVVRHYVDSTLAYDDYTCGSGSGKFQIPIGEGVAVGNDFFADIDWLPAHY